MLERPLDIESAIRGRRSVRSFRPDPVSQSLVETILNVAARAPSGTNMQPWRVYVVSGDRKARLSERLLEAHASGTSQFDAAEYQYYPHPFFEPFLGRRRKVGFGLYNLLGILKGDQERMHRQHARNYMFFGAPVGFIFTIDRRLEIGSWLDYGMFLQNIMLAARAHGLETCVQAAFAPFHATIRAELAIGEGEVVICGMSLGYADPSAPENHLETERSPAAEFATFLGSVDP